MRRLSAASARQVVRAVAVFAVAQPGESGETRGELEPPGQPPSASALPLTVPRCGEEDKSESASSGLRDLTVLTEQKLAQREGGREGRGERRNGNLD